jgi:hypothetical protein
VKSRTVIVALIGLGIAAAFPVSRLAKTWREFRLPRLSAPAVPTAPASPATAHAAPAAESGGGVSDGAADERIDGEWNAERVADDSSVEPDSPDPGAADLAEALRYALDADEDFARYIDQGDFARQSTRFCGATRPHRRSNRPERCAKRKGAPPAPPRLRPFRPHDLHLFSDQRQPLTSRITPCPVTLCWTLT